MATDEVAAEKNTVIPSPVADGPKIVMRRKAFHATMLSIH